jgi:hypothetical protein
MTTMIAKTFFATVAAASLVAAFAAHAAPQDTLAADLANPLLVLASDHGHGDRNQMHGDHNGQSASNCANSEDDGDDDEGDGNCGSGAPMMNQNANPPANGLFAPGSAPKAQVN